MTPEKRVCIFFRLEAELHQLSAGAASEVHLRTCPKDRSCVTRARVDAIRPPRTSAPDQLYLAPGDALVSRDLKRAIAL
jgi:hypothetical protein